MIFFAAYHNNPLPVYHLPVCAFAILADRIPESLYYGDVDGKGREHTVFFSLPHTRISPRAAAAVSGTYRRKDMCYVTYAGHSLQSEM